MTMPQIDFDAAKQIYGADVPPPVAQEPSEIPPDQSANNASPGELDALASKLQQPAAAAPAPMEEVPDEEQPPMPEDAGAADEPSQPLAPPPGVTPPGVPIADQLKQEDMALQNDLVAGHIKPESYNDLFSKKETLGKIGTIFGLLVGGAGAGLSHQPNALLGMMDKEIERDFEAQKANQGNDLNTARFNMEKKVNLAHIEQMKKQGVLTEQQAKVAGLEFDIKHDALEMMRKRRIGLHKLVSEVNKYPLGSPQRAQAEQKLAALSDAVSQGNFDLADQAAAKSAFLNTVFGSQSGQGGAGNQDPEQAYQQRRTGLMRLGMHDLVKDMDEHHVPGVDGQSSAPVTEDYRNKVTSGMQFQNKLHRMIQFVKDNPGPLNYEKNLQGQAMAAELSSAYRSAIGGGVYKPTEQDFIGQVIDPDPTKFFNKVRVLPKLMTVQRESQSDLNDLVKSRGFKGYQASEPQAEMSMSKTGKPMIYQNGKWYYKK